MVNFCFGFFSHGLVLVYSKAISSLLFVLLVALESNSTMLLMFTFDILGIYFLFSFLGLD